jgi:hypothetical protein
MEFVSSKYCFIMVNYGINETDTHFRLFSLMSLILLHVAPFLAMVSPNWHFETTVMYRAKLLTLCPTPNLEDHDLN